MVAYTHSILNRWKNHSVGWRICMHLFVRETTDASAKEFS